MSEMFKMMENIKKKVEIVPELQREVKELKEVIRGKVISGHFVEEDVVIDINYVNDGAERMMLVDCGAPK